MEEVSLVDFEGERGSLWHAIRISIIRGLTVAVEICEDLWAPNPPSTDHALAGATILVNLSASDETTGKSSYRRSLIAGQSARLLAGYIYASAGEGESSTDLVFGGHNVIAENGTILAEAPLYTYIYYPAR